jgi:hypothetical protein
MLCSIGRGNVPSHTLTHPGLGQVSGHIPHSQAPYLEPLCGLFEHPWGEGSEARPVSACVFEYTHFTRPQAV